MSMVYTGTRIPNRSVRHAQVLVDDSRRYIPSAAAQYAPPGDQNILYGVKKNQMPQGVVVEQGTANSGIPTSGTQQAQQLKKNQPGYSNPGYGYPGYGGPLTIIATNTRNRRLYQPERRLGLPWASTAT